MAERKFHSKGALVAPFILTFYHRLDLTLSLKTSIVHDERINLMIDDLPRPFTPKHYTVAKVLVPKIWDEHHEENIRWCLWAKQPFYPKSTYFGVQFWFEREAALSKADEILKAINYGDISE